MEGAKRPWWALKEWSLAEDAGAALHVLLIPYDLIEQIFAV